jgi:hypothetical protein
VSQSRSPAALQSPPRAAFVIAPIAAVGLLLALALYTGLSYVAGANSDNMSALLVARDMAEGNIFLKGWTLSTQSFLFTDTVWTAIVIRIVGYHPIIAHVMPAAMYIALVLVAGAIVWQERPKNVVLLAPLLAIPTVFTTLVGLELTVHGGISLAAIVFAYALNGRSRRFLLVVSPACAILWALVIASDALFIYIFVIPAILAASFAAFRREPGYSALAAAAVLSLPLAALVQGVQGEIFAYDLPGVSSATLATPAIIIENLKHFTQGIAYYYAIHFDRGWLAFALSVLRLAFAGGMICAFLVLATRSWPRSFIDAFLIAATVVPSAAFLFSTVPLDAHSSRYFYFSVIALTIFVARNLAIMRYAPAVCAVAVVLAVTNLEDFRGRWPPEDERYRDLSEFLSSHGLEKGYAPYWQASITSAMGSVHVAPVVIQTASIAPFYWLSKKGWYRDKRQFFIATNPEERLAAVAHFGTPSRELPFGSFSILVWARIGLAPTSILIPDVTRGRMFFDAAELTPDGARSTGRTGFLMWGPYAPLKKGRYEIELFGASEEGTGHLAIVSEVGNFLLEMPMEFDANGRMAFDFELPRSVPDLQVRVHVDAADRLTVRGFSITGSRE